MQMSYLYASDFPFKNFRKLSSQTCRNNTKKCLGKELWRVLVVHKSTDHDKPTFRFVFYYSINVKENAFFIQSARRARAEKGIARHTDASSVVRLGTLGTSNFWLVRSEHAHASYPGLFARPGSSPIWGGKKGEFRDWTNDRPTTRL